MHTVTIRMGAAHWDASIRTGAQALHFDFRKMSKGELSAFHREFMNAFRRTKKEGSR